MPTYQDVQVVVCMYMRVFVCIFGCDVFACVCECMWVRVCGRVGMRMLDVGVYSVNVCACDR